MARKSRRTRRLRVVNPDCAGIDIGKERHFVAVDPERSDEPVRSFGAFTRDLEAMAAWLASCGVSKVAMESTSVYWIAVYETLERAGFEVMLVPPRMTKQIGGRKSDVLDCQWIWQLMSYGLLRGAFRPGDEVCPLRSYARQMRRLTGDRSRCVLHMQKALTEMNVRLDSVIASEIGPDFSAFPSAQHFCSWLALAPGTRISGGKNLPGTSPKAVNPVGQALRMAAMAARRSQTFIGAKHRARLARMDTPVAVKATARELAGLIYLMVTEGQEYVEQGIDAYEKRRLNRKFAHLDRQAQKLGLQLVPKTQGEEQQNPMPFKCSHHLRGHDPELGVCSG